MIRRDAVAELAGLPGGVEPADRGRGVHHVADPGGVEALPTTAVVEHLDHVRDQHVVVRVRVTRRGWWRGGYGRRSTPTSACGY